MKIFLQKIGKYKNFQDTSFSYDLNFNEGLLIFNGTQMSYYSLKEYEGEDFCFDDICVENNGGFEKIYCTLPNSFEFKENIELGPSGYVLLFTNIKNESKISISIK